MINLLCSIFLALVRNIQNITKINNKILIYLSIHYAFEKKSA